MAIAAATQFEVRTTGSDSNSGGFVAGAAGTDYSQQDAAQFDSPNGFSSTASTNFFDGTVTFTSAVVGNLLWASSGVNTITARPIEITGYVDANNITLQETICAAAGDATDIVYRIGGALATPGRALLAAVAGNRVHLRGGADPEASPYSITSTSANVASGRLNAAVQLTIEGYLTTRGDCTIGGLRPVIKAGVNSITMVTYSNNLHLMDVVLDGDKATRTSTVGIGGSSGGVAKNVTVRNCTGNGYSNANLTICHGLAHSNGGIGFNGFRQLDDCVSRDNTSHGAVSASTSSMNNTLIHSNGGDGYNGAGTCLQVNGCTIANNTGDGLETSALTSVVNSIFYGNGGYQIRNTATTSWVEHVNCAFGDVGSGVSTGNAISKSPITLSSSPFVDEANDNYTLDPASAGGIQCKGTGVGLTDGSNTVPGTFDLGAIQLVGGSGGGYSAARRIGGI